MSSVGIVESITSKDINTKYGLKKKYSVKIDGTWYDAGWKKPTVAEGTTVTFNSKDTTYGRELDGGLVPTVAGLGAGTSTAAKPAATTRGKYDAVPFPVPPLDPSRSIIRQNALRHATATVNMQLEQARHAGVGTSSPSISQIVESVVHAARQYEEYISGYDAMNEAQAKVEKDA